MSIKALFSGAFGSSVSAVCRVFTDLFSKTTLELDLYPTPQAVIEAEEEQVVAEAIVQKKNTRSKSWAWARKKAKKMMTAASDNPKMVVSQSHLFILRQTIELLFRNQEHLTQLENEIDALARNIKEYDLLRSIPGVGDKIDATILSEIRDIDQFEHAKKLVAFAGSDPSVYASGKFVATTNRITKRGSKRLWRALFLAIQCGLREQQTKNSIVL